MMWALREDAFAFIYLKIKNLIQQKICRALVIKISVNTAQSLSSEHCALAIASAQCLSVCRGERYMKEHQHAKRFMLLLCSYSCFDSNFLGLTKYAQRSVS